MLSLGRSAWVYKRAELNGNVDSENNQGGSSSIMYYIGLDVHKKTISYCVKDASGQVHREGTIGATRNELDAGYGPFLSPGSWRWKRRSSPAGSMIICFRMPRT